MGESLVPKLIEVSTLIFLSTFRNSVDGKMQQKPQSLLTSGVVWGFGESFERCHPYLSVER